MGTTFVAVIPRDDEGDEPSEPPGQAGIRRRSIIAPFLLVVSVIAVIATTVAWWAHGTLFDTDAFVATLEPVVTSDEVALAVSEFVADEAIAVLDIERRLTERLGAIDAFLAEGLAEALDAGPAVRRAVSRLDIPQLANLASPIADSVEERIRSRTLEYVASGRVQGLLLGGIDRVHGAAIALARGDVDAFENLGVVDGEVRWDLVPVVVATIREALPGSLVGLLDDVELPTVIAGPSDQLRSALGEALGATLDDDFGQVTLVTEEQLAGWRQLVSTLDRLVWILTIATIGVIAAALVVSRQRRRTTLWIAFGCALGVAAVLLVQRELTDSVIAAVEDPARATALRVTLDSALAGVRRALQIVLALGVFVGLAAYIVGKPTWLARMRTSAAQVRESDGRRRLDARVVEHRDGFLAGGIVAALLVWWRTGLSLGAVLVVGGLLVLYLAYVGTARTQASADSNLSDAELPRA